MRSRYGLACVALMVVAWGAIAQAGISDLQTVQTLLFRAVGNEPNILNMTGAKVVPPSGSLETGTANVSYADPNLNYNITHNVVGETSAAIRGPAYGYENGPVIFVLPLGSPKIGSVMLNATQETWLLEGRLSIQIDSGTFPSGAIRTQIQAVNPPMEGRAVWIRVQVLNLGPDPYDGTDALKFPGLRALPPPARGTKITVDIDEPSKPWDVDRPAAVASRDFLADIAVGQTIEFDLGYVSYFPTFPLAATQALAEVDTFNVDPNPGNNTANNTFDVLPSGPVPAVGTAGLLALGLAFAGIAIAAARRRRRDDKEAA
jgi:hypothetical protein